MSYNFCTGKIHGYGDSTQSWPTSDRQDETSTIESETQRPRQTRFQHFSFSDPIFFSRASRHLRARTKTSRLYSPVTGSTGGYVPVLIQYCRIQVRYNLPVLYCIPVATRYSNVTYRYVRVQV